MDTLTKPPAANQEESDDDQLSLATIQVPITYEPAMVAISKAIDAVKPGCDEETFFRAAGLVEALGTLYTAAKKAWNINGVAKLEADGRMSLGEIDYYADYNKDDKNIDVRATLIRLFELSGGDKEQAHLIGPIADCISKNGLKAGATKKMLGDEARQHFKTVVTSKVKSTKPPEKAVQKFNAAFVR